MEEADEQQEPATENFEIVEDEPEPQPHQEETTQETHGIPPGYDETRLEVESKTEQQPDRRQQDIPQDFNRRQTDMPLEVVVPEEEEELVEPKQKSKALWFLIAVLLIIVLLSGAAYYFLFANTNENQYAADARFLQNRGFLGEMSDPTKDKVSEEAISPSADQIDNLSRPELNNIPSEPGDNGLLGRVQSITENAAEAATRALGESAIDTISAVNALLENRTSDSVPEETADPIQDVPVFQINRTKPVEGTSTSLAYAQDNAQSGERDAARLEYEELLRNQPTNRNALIGLAQIYAQSGENALAKEYYSRLLQLNPQDPVAQVGLLESSQSSDLVAFEVELKTLMTQYPEYAFIPFKLGNLFASQGRWSEAKTAYRSALANIAENNSGVINPAYSFNLAVALEKTQQPQLALEKYIETRKLVDSYSSPPGFDLSVLNARIESLSGNL